MNYLLKLTSTNHVWLLPATSNITGGSECSHEIRFSMTKQVPDKIDFLAAQIQSKSNARMQKEYLFNDALISCMRFVIIRCHLFLA